MPLKDLDIQGNKNLRDIKPLAGLPLEKLNAGRLPITEISALRGMPLMEVNLYSYTNTIQDYSPLAPSPTREKITLNEGITDTAFLATLPKLKQVEYHRGGPVADLAPLRGLPIEELNILHTGVSDLAPLRGMPLQKLDVIYPRRQRGNSGRNTMGGGRRGTSERQCLLVERWTLDVGWALLKTFPESEGALTAQGGGEHLEGGLEARAASTWSTPR